MWLVLVRAAAALTCDEVFTRTANGEPEESVAQAIRIGGDMTTEDLGCLQAGGASRVLLEAAKWRVARSQAPAPAPRAAPGVSTGSPRVDITVVGAIFNATKRGGEPWDQDGVGQAAGVVGTAANLVTGGAVGTAVGLARAGEGALGIEKPDPEGWAQALPADGSRIHQRMWLQSDGDTLNAEFERAPTWRGFPLDRSIAIRVHLWDRDPGGNDDIPSIDLGYDDLQAAFARGGVHEVHVTGAAGELVRSVLVRVRSSAVSNVDVDGLLAP